MSSGDPTVEANATPHATDETLDASLPGGDATLQRRAAERYHRLGEIARGGMGRIIAARDLELGRVIAIKELLTDSAALDRRFEREVRITARLQHPGIIAVQEAGRWPDGKAFYTMPHVAGRPLDAVIAEATTLPARLALVPRVLAVADALAYAHGEQFIHRDLKPSNVLVGAFGETIVIDWGLAKNLRDPDDESLGGARSGDGAVTVLGDAIGTPSYMPPEQARGARVDARADVYALGAILYHVLAGARPYADTQVASDVVDRVLAGPPPPLDALTPEAPADLRAIVAKAMARAPAERYPTAATLADDLRRFTTGQLVGAHRYSLGQILGRWLRRHRAVVAVGGAAAAALAVVAVLAVQGIRGERDVATTQRGLAEAHRAEVEELLEFMLLDLHDKLKAVGKVELLGMVATKAATYYQTRPIDRADRAAMRRRGVALTHVGDVEVATGDLPAAIASYRQAEARFAQIDADRDRVNALELLGRALTLQGARDEALAIHRECLAILARLLAAAPAADVELALLARTASNHMRVGNLLAAQGDLAGALATHRDGLAIAERRAARLRDDLDAQRSVAVMHTAIGDVLEAQLELPGALAAYRAAQAIMARLAAVDPDDIDRQRGLSLTLDRVGIILTQQRDFVGALEANQQGLAIAARLAARDPDNALWARDLSISHVSVGDVHKAEGAWPEALAAYQAAHAIRARLAALDPSNAEAARDLANSFERVGGAELELARRDRAVVAYQASDAIRQRLAAAAPDDPIAQRDRYLTPTQFGDVAEAGGELDAALRWYREALALAEQAVARFPDAPQLAADLEQLRGEVARLQAAARR